ncbi:hypothetical protein D3C81_999090 [compost metagenome]
MNTTEVGRHLLNRFGGYCRRQFKLVNALGDFLGRRFSQVKITLNFIQTARQTINHPIPGEGGSRMKAIQGGLHGRIFGETTVRRQPLYRFP